jgi:CheY-like chemotaxis protein
VKISEAPRLPDVPEGATDSEAELAGALHEVSNALTVVLGWLDAAVSELGPGRAREAIEVARAHARLGHRLARRAIGAQVLGDDGERSALALARDAVLGVAQEAERRGVQVTLDDAAFDDALLRDPPEGLQILLNLLLNAIAFSPQGGVVTLALKNDGGVLFSVIDQGPGVPPERADLILSGSPDSTRAGGAGIGLKHCHALANKRGGELRLNRAGPGAHFDLRWPIAEVRSSARSSRPATRDLDGARVLIVEDDAAVRSLVELALTARGAEVLCASNLQELDRIMARGVLLDAALVDLSPIAEDLHGALAKLRRDNAEVPIILISGLASGVPPTAEGEFAAWVRKPFEMGEVVDTLTSVLRPV